MHEFVYDPDMLWDTPPFGEVPTVILCTEHAYPRCRGGFQAVQRLEQYAFLLNVALRRLYLLLKKQGMVPMSHGVSQQQHHRQQQQQQPQHVHQPGTLPKRSDDALTLADISQLMEVAQAREQHRSLPRETPFIAELSALELAIVKHCAVLALIRSPLKDHVELDEILEMIENKKSGFWNKLFKGDKTNVKKKGGFFILTFFFFLFFLPCSLLIFFRLKASLASLLNF
jgi:hypothetical protein